MIKILIAGIGGVGGYFGGLLAKEFQDSKTVAVNFLARGEHLRVIQQNGLTIIKGDEEIVAHPANATDRAKDLGEMDYVMVCTKSYDLDDVILQLSPCINKDTIIIPLLNGVDNRQRIETLLPENVVCDGCVYIVSRLAQPGVIQHSGKLEDLYFGLNGVENERLLHLAKLFAQAGIHTTLTKDILVTLWEKFIFLAPIATATSYYNKSIGVLWANEESWKTIEALVDEAIQLASLKNIELANDIAERTLHKIESLPFENTTSMHNDFKSGKGKTEIESLTGYVVKEGFQLGVVFPVFERLYNVLIMNPLITSVKSG
jgi:2-dehydropantoate 2-reductase